MRIQDWKSVVALALVMAAYVGASERAQAQADAKAAAVVAEMRKALGGEQKIAGVKGLSLRADYRRELSMGPGGGGGTTTFVMMGPGGAPGGGQQTTGKIEIDLDLPDKYLRIDIGSAAFGMTRTEGFEAARPFLEIVPNSPGMRITVDSPATDPTRAKAALKRTQTDLARLYLGLTGGTQPGFAATYSFAGQAESPDGKADIIDVTGPDDFKVRLFVDAETHLPLMLTYMEPEPRVFTRTMRDGSGGRGGSAGPIVVPGGAPPAGSPPVSTGASAAGGTQASGSAPAHNTPTAGLTPEQRDEIEKQRREAEATPPKLVEYHAVFLGLPQDRRRPASPSDSPWHGCARPPRNGTSPATR